MRKILAIAFLVVISPLKAKPVDGNITCTANVPPGKERVELQTKNLFMKITYPDGSFDTGHVTHSTVKYSGYGYYVLSRPNAHAPHEGVIIGIRYRLEGDPQLAVGGADPFWYPCIVE